MSPSRTAATTVAALAATLSLGTVVPAHAVSGDAAGTAGTASSSARQATVDRQAGLGWRHVDIATDQRLRGLDALSARKAWVSGLDGGVWKTRDGGRSWVDVSPAGAEGLQFRDIEATSMRRVQVLAIGEGTDSRILRTTNGGRTWRTTFVNREPTAFYDCMAMWPGGRHGLAMSDPVNGRFRIIATHDGGRSWNRVSPEGMPDAVDGEFAFAASGTCLVTTGRRSAYLASGGAAARVFVTRDRGRHWFVRRSTLPASATDGAGVFSLAFQRTRRGLAVGGNLADDTLGTGFAATTRSAGRRWLNVGDLGGYRSGVDWRRARGDVAVAVGPTGSDVTRDRGRTWRTFDTGSLDSVQCVRGHCWASGDLGAVTTLRRR